MNEQKEIKWWEKEFYARFSSAGDFCGCYEGDLTGTWPEAKKDLLDLISRVELDARKDERERVLGEVNSEVKTGENGEGLPFENSPEIYGNARIEAYKRGYNKACSDISTTVKSLSGNNE